MKNIIEHIHHLFIPRHTNNYRAKLLHHDFLTAYLILALTFTIGIGHIQKSQGSVLGFATDITTNKLHELTNVERSKANLPVLKYNEKLAEAAKKKAQDMFSKNYWAHYGPAGETPWDFILGSGYQYEFAGENLAKNFLFSDGVVNAWMDSPSHRENILRKEYTDVGYSVVNGVLNDEETTLVVQMFGKPLYAQANADDTEEPPIVNNPIEVQQPNQEPVVLSKTANPSFFPIFFNMNIIFFSILIAALILDFYFAMKLNLITIKGKNLVHVMFLIFILVGAFILVRGSII